MKILNIWFNNLPNKIYFIVQKPMKHCYCLMWITHYVVLELLHVLQLRSVVSEFRSVVFELRYVVLQLHYVVLQLPHVVL